MAAGPKKPVLVFTYELEDRRDTLTCFADGEVVYDVRGANSSGDLSAVGRYRTVASKAQQVTAAAVAKELSTFDDSQLSRPLPSAIPIRHFVQVGTARSIDLSLPLDESGAAVVKRAALLGHELVQLAKSAPVALARLSAVKLAGGVALSFSGEGRKAVTFLLQGKGVSIHGPSGAVWNPQLTTGLVTADARGLGGLGTPATLRPGERGVVALELVPPLPADSPSVTVFVDGEMEGAPFRLSAVLR